MEEQILTEKNVVVRHSAIEIAEHWVIAISGLVLLFSGFGEFPMYKRYMVTQIPGLGWTGDFWIHLKIHYLAAIVFTGAVLFHIVYHGILVHRGLMPQKGDGMASLKTILSFIGIGEEPKADKYLPEQRLAYAFIGIVSLILIVTGLLKVIKNLPYVYLPPGIIAWSTLTHTFATFFFLFGFLSHIAALVLKVNWPLVKPIFTGMVDLDYVRHRHTLWYEELLKKQPPVEDKTEDQPPPETITEAASSPETEILSEIPSKSEEGETPAALTDK
jgi:cytochrome b subunit of formate dehydrogenase